MFTYMARAITRKKECHLVNTICFCSSQIMDMSAYITWEKSVKDRNFIKCNLCLTKVHLMYLNYTNHIDFQYIKFSNKRFHCYNCNKDFFSFATINNFKLYYLLAD